MSYHFEHEYAETVGFRTSISSGLTWHMLRNESPARVRHYHHDARIQR